LAVVGAVALARRSTAAAGRALVAGLAVAGWAAWLRRLLIGPEPGAAAWVERVGSPALGLATASAALAAAWLLRGRGRTFRLLLAAAFGYLAGQAVRNASLFGLVAGTLIAWNLGEWEARLAEGRGGDRPVGGWAAPLLLSIVLAAWPAVVATGRFFAWAG